MFLARYGEVLPGERRGAAECGEKGSSVPGLGIDPFSTLLFARGSPEGPEGLGSFLHQCKNGKAYWSVGGVHSSGVGILLGDHAFEK
ncbi:hypothetical protein P4O66_007246, partial [Electrophorus voltai]